MKDFVSSKDRLFIPRNSFKKKIASFIGTCLLITVGFTLMTIELESTHGITATSA